MVCNLYNYKVSVMFLKYYNLLYPANLYFVKTCQLNFKILSAHHGFVMQKLGL